MNRRLLLATCALACLPAAGQTPEPAQTAGLEPAAIGWLQLLDAGDASATWASASAAFKAALTSAQWRQALQGARTPLGAVRTRRAKSTRFTRSLPGAPDGQYAVLEFDTAFENKTVAVETLTAVLESDGVWRVGGYFIR
jgi:hypothetical protein